VLALNLTATFTLSTDVVNVLYFEIILNHLVDISLMPKLDFKH